MYALECQRFSLGPFERGPIRFFFESASVDAAPDECLRQTQNVTFSGDALESLWVNDHEVAAFLKEVYGMPVYYAAIEARRETINAGEHYVWTMTDAAGAVSSFDTQVDLTDYRPFPTLHYRFFWWNDTAVSYLNWGITENALSSNHPTTGQPQPPLVMSDWPTDYAGFGSVYHETEATGKFALFNDLECKSPRT